MQIIDQLNAGLAPRYEVERQLAEGGMATVYLARDLRHNRPVAVKVLKRELGAMLGPERFLAEIAVTASLQHPHLLPLFDSGEVDGLLYYVMPYVEGETLRARLAREHQLPVDEAIRLTRGIASALDYAHKRGVIHRDLKPENILLHGDEPLVSDFGIALAVSKAAGERITQSGITVGTPQYMSPEQAAGDHRIDARSDVYSLGAMLYEMLAGEPPHTGPTPQSIIAKIVAEDPKPVAALRKAVSPEVDAAVERALAKVPADRFGTAGDFATALGDSTTKRHRTAHPATGSYRPLARGKLVAAMVAAAVAGGIVAYALLATTGEAVGPGSRWASFGRAAPTWGTSETIVSQLTNYDGSETGGAIAPDGRSFVFVSNHGGQPDVWRRQISGGEPVRLTNDAAIESDLIFAPDGESIYYTRSAGAGRTSALFEVPGADVSIWRIGALGGQPRKVVGGARAPSPSADGRSLAWYRPVPDGSSSLMVGTIDGTGQRALVKDVQAIADFNRASWSPDGRLLAYSSSGLFAPSNLFVVGVADSVVRQVTHFERGTEGPRTQAWLPDNQHLVISYFASPKGQGATDLGIVDVRTGAIVRVTTNVAEGFAAPSLSADATRMIVTSSRVMREVWKVPIGSDPSANGRNAVRLVEASLDPMWTFVTRDGHTLLFNNALVGSRNLWTVSLKSKAEPRQVTSMAGNSVMHSSLSPDGTSVAFASMTAGSSDIWVQHVDGSNLRQLTNDRAADAWPVWSPDGQSIMFASLQDGAWLTRRLSLAGGAPEKVVDGFFRGDWIARSDHTGTWIVTATLAGGLKLLDGERHTIVWQDTTVGIGMPMFSPDGKTVSMPYREARDREAIRVYDVATGAKRLAVRLPQRFRIMFRADWVDDGRAFVVNRLESTSHIVLFDRFWVEGGKASTRGAKSDAANRAVPDTGSK
ncbi:MAG: protein kinase [Gemmatimonadaceae bacterium]